MSIGLSADSGPELDSLSVRLATSDAYQNQIKEKVNFICICLYLFALNSE